MLVSMLGLWVECGVSADSTKVEGTKRKRLSANTSSTLMEDLRVTAMSRTTGDDGVRKDSRQSERNGGREEDQES